MELNISRVTATKGITLPWGQVSILPIGDIQLGATGVDLDALKKDIDWGLKHNSYFIGMGDYHDVASPSNRTALRTAKLYDSVRAMLSDGAEKGLEDLKKIFKGTEGRWLGLHEGHHFFDFDDGTTTDTRLAEHLGAPFLGSCALSRFTMQRGRGTTLKVDVWSHHGAGSGVSLTAPLNKLEKVAGAFDADIFLINHYQRAGWIPKDWLYMSQTGQLKYKKRHLIATGGYMRGYEAGSMVGTVKRGSYVEQNLLIPTNLGGMKIFLTPNRKENQIEVAVLGS